MEKFDKPLRIGVINMVQQIPRQSPGHWTSGWNRCRPRMLSGTLLQTRVMVLH